MKHQFLIGMMLAASLIIACNQKEAESKFKAKPVASTPLAMVPESPDTLLSNGRRNIFLISRRELPGLFVERSIFPTGYRSNPHTHPGNLNITVISGTFNLALTSNPDSVTVAKVYGPGSFVIIPANQPHFEWFTETTIVDITGIGPLQTINLPIVHSSK
jgi:quercetin dioxygenase-like cupin family protein